LIFFFVAISKAAVARNHARLGGGNPNISPPQPNSKKRTSLMTLNIFSLHRPNSDNGEKPVSIPRRRRHRPHAHP
jgi:hypothetical protein